MHKLFQVITAIALLVASTVDSKSQSTFTANAINTSAIGIINNTSDPISMSILIEGWAYDDHGVFSGGLPFMGGWTSDSLSNGGQAVCIPELQPLDTAWTIGAASTVWSLGLYGVEDGFGAGSLWMLGGANFTVYLWGVDPEQHVVTPEILPDENGALRLQYTIDPIP